ncbi:hypothetical protein GCM10009715_41510 [Paeniglutamicibacter psychrophenolicus]|uniref:Uncharacterized protein n=1 Tax=Paeniglutamicibacter psychrophenolicus TaxID=257454 RepID=A0ABS4WJQ3_9MICC|nr:hypothetical protein [Paeniglutamicibacter psychrophenolicus]
MDSNSSSYVEAQSNYPQAQLGLRRFALSSGELRADQTILCQDEDYKKATARIVSGFLANMRETPIQRFPPDS